MCIIKFRAVTKFLVEDDKNLFEIYEPLKNVYEDSSLDRALLSVGSAY